MAENLHLAERLAQLVGEIPDEALVLALPDQYEVSERGMNLAYRLAESFRWEVSDTRLDRRRATTVLRAPEQGRITVFHASGAVAVRSNTAPFDELFEEDPGDEVLAQRLVERLGGFGLPELSEAQDLAFERLWRIRATGSDPDGKVIEPVLCRAVGAFRHSVHGIPVLGRASAHLELTGHGRVTAASVSMRSPIDGGSQVVAKGRIRDPFDASREIVARLSRMIDGAEPGDEVQAEALSFGYLSLGRRRAQSVLAPHYVAAVSIEGGEGLTRSAHLIPVAATDERFLSLPRGAAPSAYARKPDPRSMVV